MVMPREEHARQNHKIKIGNNNFEKVEYFKYLEITLTNKKCIHKEIKSRMNSRNSGYHTAQILFSSRSQSKNIQNYKFVCCFVWVRKLVFHCKGGTYNLYLSPNSIRTIK
jgi:hypothetical protein